MRASVLAATDLDSAQRAVRNEVASAVARFGDFNSTHEALGVLSEEWDELRAAIHANALGPVSREAMQVASVALRLHALCELAMAGQADEFKVRSGA